MHENIRTINNAFNEFRNQIDTTVIKQLNLYCVNILQSAIRFRFAHSHTDGHDYTGNLVNSITVILYDQGEVSDVFYPAKDATIKAPKYNKMTARKKPYIFREDYSGRRSKYRAEVKTNGGVAQDDILAFVGSCNPSYTKGYCIVVAYTVEYANWVEMMRGTTGIVETERYAGRIKMDYIKKVA